jgi:hypothetical protein
METGTPEFARVPKAGLQRSALKSTGRGQGTQAPGEGFALTIAERECARLDFEHEHDRHDVALGVALVAAKRASLVGRGPQLSDVRVALELFGLRAGQVVDHAAAQHFAGLAHSYVAQRRFVDAVGDEQLLAPSS